MQTRCAAPLCGKAQVLRCREPKESQVEIKATDVKALREKTGAGMMECKKALVDANGDFAKAEKLLKELGLAAVEKRAGRATNEGKVFVKVIKGKAALVELSCETDFVARNSDFISCGGKIADTILAKGKATTNDDLAAFVRDTASVIKENLALKRFLFVEAGKDEILHEYIHGDGKIGVLVRAKSDVPAAFEKEAVKNLIHDIALHIAAFNPGFLDRSKVSPDYIKEQEEIFKKQLEGDERLKGKPDKVLEGALKGKLGKHLGDICLLDQAFVKDEKLTVAKVLAAVGKEAGCSLSISEFFYFRVGE
jgi:elongation factor Ts